MDVVNKTNGVIGVMVEELAQFTSPDIIEGIVCRLEDFGYKSVIMDLRLYSRWSDKWFDNESMMDELLSSYLNDIRKQEIDGLIYVAAHARNVTKIPEDFPIPAVMIYSNEMNAKVPSVMLDDDVSAFKAVRYLIDKGHRKITISAGEANNLHTQQRLEGAYRALELIGVSREDARVVYAGWVRESGYRNAEEILGNDSTAVFCMSDRQAGGLYKYMYEHGIRPGEDVSVIGFDNAELSQFLMPGLTTMSLPLRMMGNTSVKLLMGMIRDNGHFDPADNIVRLPCPILERNSVATIKEM